MAALSRSMVYALADSLGMTLGYDGTRHALTGKEDRDVNIEGLRLRVPMEVVSCQLSDSAYMLIVKMIGNLALLAVSKRVQGHDVVDIHVLNLAKMDRAHGWLEKTKPSSVNDALRRLDKAVVKTFVKIKNDEWEEAA